VLRSVRQIERDADLLIEGNRISAVGRDLPLPENVKIIDAHGCVVIPGLINAHTHLYQNILKGASTGLRLVEWCTNTLFPTVEVILQEQRAGNTHLNYLWSMLGALEMIRAGTTCCQNMDVSANNYLPGILQAWREVGLRGVGAVNLVNRAAWMPSRLLGSDQGLYSSVEALIEHEHNPKGMIQIALGPSTPFMCDEELLRWVAATAADRNLGIQIHVSETAGETMEAQQEWGITPVERLEAAGILGERLSAVHCVHVNQAEIELLASCGTTVVHCPKSNMKLASGVMDWPALKKAGVQVGLGNDGCASNDLLDMWEEMRVAALLATVTDKDPATIGPAEVFRAATEGSARACRVFAGVLDPGRLADVVIVDLSAPHLRPVHNILNTLVYCARSGDVRDVIIDGCMVMRNRRVVTVNETELIEEADEMAGEIYARSARVARAQEK
jgi:5-methylthioadenosine/S-adenosylhomocysteine deaminase